MKSEHASPRQIGWAVGVGVFVGCTPAMGVHGWLAMLVATPLKLNRLFALIGSRVSNFLCIPWIVLAEIQTAHWLRTGHFAQLNVDTILSDAPTLLLDWLIGMIPIGITLGILLGFLAFGISTWRVRARQRRQITPSPE